MTGISDAEDFIPLFNDYYNPNLTNHLIILPDETACRRFSKQLHLDHHLILNPSPQPYSDLLFSSNLMHDRVKAFYLAQNTTGKVFISHPAALSFFTISPKEFDDSVKKFEYADSFFHNPTESLIRLGYQASPFVEKIGQFTQKGGIIDIFSPAENHPVRISLFGDEIESLHHYSVKTQRNISELESFTLCPASEFFYPTTSDQKELLGLIHNSKTDNTEWKRHSLEALRNKAPFDKMHLFSKSFWNDSKSAWSYFDKGKTRIICFDYKECEKVFSNFKQECIQDFELLDDQNYKKLSPPEMLLEESFNLSNFENLIDVCPVFIEDISSNQSTSFITGKDDYPVHSLQKTLKYNKSKSSRWEEYAQETKKLINQLSKDYKLIITCSGSSSLKKCESFLNEYEIEFQNIEELNLTKMNDGPQVFLQISNSKVSAKYDLDKTVLINNEDLFGSLKNKRVKETASNQFFETLDLLQMSDLNIDDLVVHRNHGVGSYKGLKILTLNNVESECLEIHYAKKDKLFLPVYSINHIRKYSDSKSSRTLDKLGGTAWQKLKSKAQKKLNDIAQDLVALYAKRKSLKRPPLTVNTSEFTLFESQFPFQETDDQLKAIEDIQNDLQQDHVMDRLICGDVGFGKTEVAMRAAFHYMNAGKQVAVMAPTTVLSMQHYQSFKTRFKNWPFKIDVLNRFVSKGQAVETLSSLKKGTSDLVVGTHRVLSSDVNFKDLGLLIVDEEQKFGVKQKEKIKSLQDSIDVLSMSATPIPRTLNMGFLGVRDLSLIKTPPKDRLPVKTYITHYSMQVIKKAIETEVARNGQAFFVHNRVQSIYGIYEELKEAMPNIRIGLGHGQMNESELEQVMIKFFNKEIDVLLSTTIIESGVDVSSANTMIINNAQNFGLSQLYQLRGRVGRSENRAYCYLLVPQNRDLEKDQKEKLKVLQDNTALGSGLQIAHHDLELRGAGNLLGEAQSGQAEEMGYELYIELLEEAINDARGVEGPKKSVDPEIVIPLPALIPNKFIQDIKSRLFYYRKISKIKDESDLDEIEAELQDQFGKIPDEIYGLFFLTSIKTHLIKMGVKELKSGPKNISLQLLEDHKMNPEQLIKFIRKQPDSFKFTPDNKLIVRYSVTTWPELFEFILSLKNKFFEC